jgi:Carboxypeptidase regulatory-like domain
VRSLGGIRGAVLLFGALLVVIVPAAVAGTPSSFGPIPYNGTEQSRCQGLHVGSHVVLPGKEVVATTSAGICGGAPKDITWSWSVGPSDQTHGCGHDQTFCRFPAGSTGGVFTNICINGANIQGAWQSCDYYAVPSKGVGVIEGTVTDKDGGPVAGVDVKAYGHGTNVSATTGADGYYAMEVRAGSYRIVPSGGSPGKSPGFKPTYNATTISAGTSGTADFELQAGILLSLKFNQASVPADGLHVVTGTITTTEFGKPAPNVGVQLTAMPGKSYSVAVSGSPRVSVCDNGTRVWPTGTMDAPDGAPVSVTTDATGHSTLAITVGTTPGTWSLDAWAKNADGSLSSDTANASDTQSVTFKPVGAPGQPPGGFLAEFNRIVKSTTTLQQASQNASPLVNTLAQATATGGSAAALGGLGYALVNAPDGQSMLVFAAADPPLLSGGSVRAPISTNGGDLVFDPAEWTGAGLPSSVTNAASLQSVLDGGLLQFLPTLKEFEAATPVQGWKAVAHSKITIFSTSFEYLGWGYPGVNQQPGACY